MVNFKGKGHEERVTVLSLRYHEQFTAEWMVPGIYLETSYMVHKIM
jgi:hypothetical protein